MLLVSPFYGNKASSSFSSSIDKVLYPKHLSMKAHKTHKKV